MKEKQEHQFKARIPQAVWDELEHLALNEERSINWEIIQAIRERIVRHKNDRKSRAQESM